MKTQFALSMIVVLAVFPPITQGGEGQKKTLDYYPLKVGTSWTFRVQAQGQNLEIVNRVAKRENINGMELVKIETLTGGRVVASEHLRSTERGVFRYRFNNLEISPPLQLIKYPIKKKGETWKQTIKMGSQEVTVNVKSNMEKVKVPAGQYRTVSVELGMTIMGKTITTKYWFAPGVGVVKQEANVAGQQVEIELNKFQQAK